MASAERQSSSRDLLAPRSAVVLALHLTRSGERRRATSVQKSVTTARERRSSTPLILSLSKDEPLLTAESEVALIEKRAPRSFTSRAGDGIRPRGHQGARG